MSLRFLWLIKKERRPARNLAGAPAVDRHSLLRIDCRHLLYCNSIRISRTSVTRLCSSHTQIHDFQQRVVRTRSVARANTEADGFGRIERRLSDPDCLDVRKCDAGRACRAPQLLVEPPLLSKLRCGLLCDASSSRKRGSCVVNNPRCYLQWQRGYSFVTTLIKFERISAFRYLFLLDFYRQIKHGSKTLNKGYHPHDLFVRCQRQVSTLVKDYCTCGCKRLRNSLPLTLICQQRFSWGKSLGMILPNLTLDFRLTMIVLYAVFCVNLANLRLLSPVFRETLIQL